MTERVIPMRSTERDNETVRHLWLKSSTARARNGSDYHVVRVGVAQGSDVEWLGAWDQSKNALAANGRFSMSGEYPLNFPLQEDDELVVGIRTFGSPASLDGMGVEVKGSRVGAIGVQDVVRRDGAYPPGAEVSAPLFGVGGELGDPAVRDAVNLIVDTLNDSGVLDWSVGVALADA